MSLPVNHAFKTDIYLKYIIFIMKLTNNLIIMKCNIYFKIKNINIYLYDYYLILGIVFNSRRFEYLFDLVWGLSVIPVRFYFSLFSGGEGYY